MNWNLYTPHLGHASLGTIVTVYLNEDKTLIKRKFTSGGVTVSGNPNRASEEYIEDRWQNEVAGLIQLNEIPWVPKLIEINVDEKYVIQEYYGPDLLTQGYKDIPDIEDQIIEIYKYFKEIDVYKLNGSLSNMTKKDGKVIMFDFKYMRKRSDDLIPYAVQEIDLWLSKITPTISSKLKALL